MWDNFQDIIGVRDGSLFVLNRRTSYSHSQKATAMAEKALTVGILVMAMAFLALSDFAADQKECGSQLVTLATCIPYVQGSAKFPAKDCCDGLLKLHLKDPKCLCVLIKDSSDPQLGLTINKTLALQLPDDCKVAANVSRCPALLHISPNSPEAQVFKNTTSPTSSTVSNVSAAPQTNTNPFNTPALKSLSCEVRPPMHWTASVLILGIGLCFAFSMDLCRGPTQA